MRVRYLVIITSLVLFGILVVNQSCDAIDTNPFDALHPMTDKDNNKLFDDLEKELQTPRETYPVIVHLTEPAYPNLLSYLKSGIGEFTVTYYYKFLKGFAANLSAKQIQNLKNYPVVVKIQWDSPVEIYMNTAADSYGVTKARRNYLVDGDRDGDPGVYTDKDVVIAFIDTGIDSGHVDLPRNKVLAWKDIIKNQPTPYDDHGHGTHVAGIAAGLGKGNEKYTGIAPGAALVVVKALDSTGKSRMSIVDAGIEWIIEEHAKLRIDVLSISFGSKGQADGSDFTSQLINYVVKSGITVITAAGNQGPSTKTIGSPAAAEKAVTVGGMADKGEGGDFLAYFTSRGPTLDGRPKPDISAPAWRIAAPQAKTTDQYIIFSGTSMAAPYTAGIVALLLDMKPDLTPEQIKELLIKTAEDWGAKGWDPDYGAGKLSIENALAKLKNPTSVLVKDRYHYNGEEDLPAEGFYDKWIIDIASVDKFIAVTMIFEADKKDDDANLYLYDPNRNLVAKGERGGRHEWISYIPKMPGSYTLEVVSYRGSGKYFLDIVGDINLLYLGADNCY